MKGCCRKGFFERKLAASCCIKKWCFSMFIKSLWLTLSLATVCEVTKIKAIQIHVLSILFYFMNRKSTIYLYSRTCLFIKGPMNKLFYNHNSVYFYWEFVMNCIYIQCIFPLMFALEVCGVHFSLIHLKPDHGNKRK